MGMVMHTGEKTEKEGELLKDIMQREKENEFAAALERINQKLDLIIEMKKGSEMEA